MQKDLSNYLGEAHDISGEWTIDEKKRFINKGLVAVATETLTTHSNIEWTVTGTTTTPLKTITIPDRMIKPMRLFINGAEYLQMDLDNFLQRLGNFVDVPQGSQISTTSSVTQFDQLNRFFFWNQGSNTFDVNPPISDTQKAVLYMIGMPKLLEKDDDISDVHPSWSYLAPVWAAMMMLDKDEEHRDRGAVATQRWRDGMRKVERFKHRSAGNKSVRMTKDPERFSDRNTLSGDGDVDWGTTFDRYP